MSLTSPLGLTRHLRRLELRLDMVPCLNVLLLGWMLMQLNSSFIYAPGIIMDLAPSPINLPAVPASALSGEPADAELTILPAVKQSQLFLLDKGGFYQSVLENGVLRIPGLQEALTARRKSLRNRPPGAPAVLLLKADASMTLLTLDTIYPLARAAGFTNIVQAAVEIPTTNSSLSAPKAPPPGAGGHDTAP